MTYREIHAYRVAPSETYGRTHKVVLRCLVNDERLRSLPHLKVRYTEFDAIVYNPQNLAFNLNHIISAIQTIHGRAIEWSIEK